MASASTPFDAAGPLGQARDDDQAQTRAFDAIYEQYGRFVWRSVCRLGVPDHAADDVVQDIFLVVHRRLAEFVEREQTVPWLYAIVIRVVRQYRRTIRRKSPAQAPGACLVDPDTLVDGRRPSPLEMAEREQAIRTLYAVLGQMNDERRDVFVLAELEQFTAPEIADALSVNLNTIYWRLKTARQEFEKILLRHAKTQPRNNR